MALGLATGCGDDPTAPPRLAGMYSLTSYGGEPLPAVVQTFTRAPVGGGDPVACTVQLVALSLEMIGTVVVRYETTVQRCDDGLLIQSYATRSDGTQARAGDQVVITFRRPIPSEPEERIYARPTGDGFVVERREYEPSSGPEWVDGTPLTFVLVP